MTPAKLMALRKARSQELELSAFPVDKLAWLFANSNRDPGGKNADGSTRPPAPVIPLEDFRSVYTKKRTLAAKDDGYDHRLMGARADKSGWVSWINGNERT